MPSNQYQINISSHPDCLDQSNDPSEAVNPASICGTKSLSLKPEVESQDFSYEEESHIIHCKAIWAASIDYLDSLLLKQLNRQLGFNDPKLFLSSQFQPQGQKSLKETLEASTTFTLAQKAQLILDLKRECGIRGLLQQLLKVFSLKVFEQIAYIVFKVWSLQYAKWKAGEVQDTLLCLKSCRDFGAGQALLQAISSPPVFQTRTAAYILKQAKLGINKVYSAVQNNSKIKYINLRQVKQPLSQDIDRHKSLNRFIITIAQCVFLCAEDYYQSPNEIDFNGSEGLAYAQEIQHSGQDESTLDHLFENSYLSEDEFREDQQGESPEKKIKRE